MSRENPDEHKEPPKKLNKELRDKALEKLGLSFFFSKNKSSGLIEKYWDYFFVDDLQNALTTANKIKTEARSQEEKDQALNLIAKILLRQGNFNQAKELMDQSKSNTGFKLFVNFLLTANPRAIIKEAAEDIDSQIYKAQSLYLSRIYWGETFLNSIDCTDDPDQIIELAFDQLLSQGEYDKALLASVQSIELILEEQLLSHDIHLPILYEHLLNLLKLAKKAKYDSTRGKLYLLKAKIFKDREAASDAEIFFGKDHNYNGLAEVYMFYAKDFG